MEHGPTFAAVAARRSRAFARILTILLLPVLAQAQPAEPAVAPAALPALPVRFLAAAGIDEALDALPLNGDAWVAALARDLGLEPARAEELRVFADSLAGGEALRGRLARRLEQTAEPVLLQEATERLELAGLAELRAAAPFPADADSQRQFEAYRERLRANPPFAGRAVAVRRLLAAGRTVELLLAVNRANESALRAYAARAWGIAETDFGEAAEAVRQKTVDAQREALRVAAQELCLYAYRYADQGTLEEAGAALADARVQRLLGIALAGLEAELAAR